MFVCCVCGKISDDGVIEDNICLHCIDELDTDELSEERKAEIEDKLYSETNEAELKLWRDELTLKEKRYVISLEKGEEQRHRRYNER